MKKQRFLSLLLAITTVLAMSPSLFVATAAEATETVTLTQKNADGYYDIPDNAANVVIGDDTYIVIRSAAEMNEYASVGGANCYILAADLNYADTNGAFTKIKIDTGIFDGNGYSMYGYALKNDSSFSGVSTSSNVRIRNITIGKSNAPIAVTSNVSTGNPVAIGLIFAYSNATHVIENVTGYATVTSTGIAQAGGLIGQINGKLTMKSCSFHGSVSGTKNTGGLIGQSGATTEIIDCVNYATVTSGSSTGGIIGATIAQPSLTVSNSVNAGPIKGGTHTGGLIGYFTDSPATVTNFANIGAITGNRVGGLIGSTVKGSGTLTMTDCGSIASATGTGRTSAIIANQTGVAPTVSGLVATSEDKGALTTIARTTVTVEEGVKWLREKFTSHLFAMSDDGLSVVIVGSNDTAAVAETKFLQYKKNANTIDVRLLGVFNDVSANLNKYVSVGFELVLKKDGVVKHTETVTVDTVYTSILANENNTIKEYTAADLGAEFLYAVELTNIPTTGTYTIEAKAFATAIGAAEAIYDNLVVITVVNGVIQ